ncbi:MAG: dehydrogenase accessory protein CooT [Deltaproteobacteria bacterium]|nr:dehydrogenase accessory protein CooT [Deltaproteobacteria bacterium]
MCEVTVFKRKGSEEVVLLKDVYRFETIFGEQKVFEADIESVSLTENKVVIRDRGQ